MKKTIILFACMLITFTSFSKVNNSRDIALHAGHENEEALRSILPVRAVLDGNTIQIEFFDSPENVVVTITDTEENEITSEVYNSIREARTKSIEKAGTYLLKILYENTSLSGEFTID